MTVLAEYLKGCAKVVLWENNEGSGYKNYFDTLTFGGQSCNVFSYERDKSAPLNSTSFY